MRFLPFIFYVVLASLSQSAWAQTSLPYGPYLSWAQQAADQSQANIGNDGDVVFNNHWFMGGEVHVFLYTGWNPGAGGYFTLPLDNTQFPLKANGNHMHPICVIGLATTQADYQLWYAAPDWPPGQQLWQDAYNLSANTVTFGWSSTWGTNLDAYAVYSLNVICPPKTNDSQD